MAGNMLFVRICRYYCDTVTKEWFYCAQHPQLCSDADVKQLPITSSGKSPILLAYLTVMDIMPIPWNVFRLAMMLKQWSTIYAENCIKAWEYAPSLFSLPVWTKDCLKCTISLYEMLSPMHDSKLSSHLDPSLWSSETPNSNIMGTTTDLGLMVWIRVQHNEMVFSCEVRILLRNRNSSGDIQFLAASPSCMSMAVRYEFVL